MNYQEFINTLPSNNLHRFDDINLFIETYLHLHPTEQCNKACIAFTQLKSQIYTLLDLFWEILRSDPGYVSDWHRRWRYIH